MRQTEMLNNVTATGIMVQDLRLFLDVFPTNKKAMADFMNVVGEHNRNMLEYEKNYGPLVGSHDQDDRWVNNPWPWQNGGMR